MQQRASHSAFLWFALVTAVFSTASFAPAATIAVSDAAEPCVVWNPHTKRWAMFYTAVTPPSVQTRVALAESSDGGVTWEKAGDVAVTFPAEFNTATASTPEVVDGGDGRHHLFVVVRRSGEARRRLVHFASADLRAWSFVSAPALRGADVVGAGISSMPGGGWRMFYRDGADSLVHFADSRDLNTWADRGTVAQVARGKSARAVFTWRGRHWLVVAAERGLAAYQSLNLDDWSAQPEPMLVLPTGGPAARMASVLVAGERALCLFTTSTNAPSVSSVTIAELSERDGSLAAQPSERIASLTTPGGARGSSGASTELAARDPLAATELHALGSRDIRAHDPSTLAFDRGEYWIFHTGRGVPSWHSKDLRTWTAGPVVFDASPAWVATAVPENRNTVFWAPDVIRDGNRWLLYYSVSSFGKRTSAIALATNATLDPAAADFKWRDEGIVVQSGNADNFNAIDPAIFRDTDGRLWLTFGSYWSGIKLLELDRKTGKRISADAPLHAVAHSRAIEAAFLYRHANAYYLFVNHGWCCRGVNSTYHIRVGRSAKITGPYLDRDGRALMDSGGTVVAGPEGPLIGPGHAGIVTIDGREWFGCHFYDATQRGRPTYALRPLTWDVDGWPVLGRIE